MQLHENKLMYQDVWYKLLLVIEILPELSEKLKPFSHRVLKDDCLDLPPKTYMKRTIQLTEEQRKVYKQMKEIALATLNGKLTTTHNVITQLMRLHQITCGHFKSDDGTNTKDCITID